MKFYAGAAVVNQAEIYGMQDNAISGKQKLT